MIGVLLASKNISVTTAQQRQHPCTNGRSLEIARSDEDGDNNILAVQVKYPKFNLRVIVAHAPQETANPDVRERFFQSLKF